jgi:hypothetical protein
MTSTALVVSSVAERKQVGGRPGWAGISHTSSMTKSLLLTFWATDKDVKASFRYAT